MYFKWTFSNRICQFFRVIATILFFKATELIKNNNHQLAVIEATQSGEVIFTLLDEILILKTTFPTTIGYIETFLVIIGMILNSLFSD
ncbi:multidrug resistance efflux transporter family protein [Clostridium sp. 1001271B_151109_B4]|uniref:multidrug resistance efflux transporter family protein n=1 Tax=Clostridium sp. 1001271B_151109_B4 TaxID=2787148 RepID=UPI0018A940C0|nr:multidrug resistance efflux transporter family protein [Clostridium sp. 1001271B_151109_B4]